MKKGATPEISAKWWGSAQPEGLNSARDLDRALGDFETVIAKCRKEPSASNLTACRNALDAIEAAAKKVGDEAAKFAKSPPKKGGASTDDYQNTAEALKKYPRVIEAAHKELVGLEKGAEADADDDDDAATLLGNEKAYQAYLKKCMLKLKQRPMNFAAGFGRTPEEHRFMFHRSKPGKAMFATLKSETNLKKLTFGLAGAHEEKPGVLTLALEGIQLPGIKKKTERLLKHFKPLPFTKVLLMIEGAEADDIVDPDDPADDADDTVTAAAVEQPGGATVADARGAEFKSRLSALLPAIQGAIAAGRAAGNDAKLKASEAGVFARKQDFGRALELLDDAEALLRAQGGDAPRQVPGAALESWRAIRGEVIVILKDLAKDIAAAKHPKSKDALLEINAVIKNLTAEPDTPQKAAELERWIRDDDVVQDVSAMAEDIRTPLLDVIEDLKSSLAA